MAAYCISRRIYQQPAAFGRPTWRAFEAELRNFASDSTAASAAFARPPPAEKTKHQLAGDKWHRYVPSQIRTAVNMLQTAGFETRLVGGVVRDAWLERRPADLDVATTATPDHVKELLGRRVVSTRLEDKGTIICCVYPQGKRCAFDVTSLRRTHAGGRHGFTDDWSIDAAGRDLTINALSMDLDGRVYDYVGGVADLNRRRVAFVGDAASNILRNPLHILRYFRFFGLLAPSAESPHESATLRAIAHNAACLADVDDTKLGRPLRLIVQGRLGPSIVRVMLDCGLAPHLGLPAQPDLQLFERLVKLACPSEACTGAPEQSATVHPVVLLATLLHDERDLTTLAERLNFSKRDVHIAQTVLHLRQGERHPTDLDVSKMAAFSLSAFTVKVW